MTDYTRFKKHLEDVRNSVYEEPHIVHHEQMIDLSMSAFAKDVKKVLDVGFGTGYSLKKFKENGVDATGITIFDKERREADFNGYNVKLMDMNFLEFEDSSFDMVWCRHAIEHSVMPYIALREFNRVLQEGGKLYIEVPSDNMIHIENKNHYSLFSDHAWQSLFKKAGFKLKYRGQYVVRIGDEKQFNDIYWYYWMVK